MPAAIGYDLLADELDVVVAYFEGLAQDQQAAVALQDCAGVAGGR